MEIGGGLAKGGLPSVVQVDEQPSPSIKFPSSHCSVLSNIPLLQTGVLGDGAVDVEVGSDGEEVVVVEVDVDVDVVEGYGEY